MNLTEVTTPTRVGPGRWRHDVPDGWQQGRGAYGGLVLATLARAVEGEAGTNGRRLRTLTGELCAPVQPGAIEIAVEILREGSGTSTVAARVVQDGQVQAHAVVVLGRARESDTDVVLLPPPERPDFRATEPFVRPHPFPPFTQHFDYRVTGPAPLTGASAEHTAGFIRARDPGPARDPAFLVAMADVWWPALFSRLAAPRPMATLTFTIDVVGDCEGLPPDAPFFHHGRLFAAHEGYAPELRTLWGADGRLLTINHQTFVVIK